MGIKFFIALAMVIVLSFAGIVLFMGPGGRMDTPPPPPDEPSCEGEHTWKFDGIALNSSTMKQQVNFFCEICFSTKAVDVDEAEHDFVRWRIDTEGDCKTRETVIYICNICGWEKVIDGDYGLHCWVRESTAFCGEVGEYQRYCQTCDLEESGSTEGLEHDLRYVEESLTGCTVPGSLSYEYCVRCSYTNYVDIKSTVHPNGKWTYTVEPTPTSKGEREFNCPDCGESYTEEACETIYTDFLIYGYDENNDKIVTGIDRRYARDVAVIKIPPTHNGSWVKGIAWGAFAGDQIITEMDMSKSYVSEITSYAFENCRALSVVKLSDYTQKICEGAFSNCESLTTVDFCRVESIAVNAFCETGLKEVTLPDSVTAIYSRAFAYCRKLTRIVLPDSVTFIAPELLFGSDSIREISVPFLGERNNDYSCNSLAYLFGSEYYWDNSEYVPKSLKSVTITSQVTVYQYSFINCSSLETVILPDTLDWLDHNYPEYYLTGCDSLRLTEYEGCTYISSTSNEHYLLVKALDDRQEPIIHPETVAVNGGAFSGLTSLESVVIPGSVKAVCPNAFEGCTNLKTVELNSGVGAVFGSAFENCTSLNSLTLSDTLVFIGERAFAGTGSLLLVDFPESVRFISGRAFERSGLTYAYIKDPVSWRNTDVVFIGGDAEKKEDIGDPEKAAIMLRFEPFASGDWIRR